MKIVTHSWVGRHDHCRDTLRRSSLRMIRFIAGIGLVLSGLISPEVQASGRFGSLSRTLEGVVLDLLSARTPETLYPFCAQVLGKPYFTPGLRGQALAVRETLLAVENTALRDVIAARLADVDDLFRSGKISSIELPHYVERRLKVMPQGSREAIYFSIEGIMGGALPSRAPLISASRLGWEPMVFDLGVYQHPGARAVAFDTWMDQMRQGRGVVKIPVIRVPERWVEKTVIVSGKGSPSAVVPFLKRKTGLFLPSQVDPVHQEVWAGVPIGNGEVVLRVGGKALSMREEVQLDQLNLLLKSSEMKRVYQFTSDFKIEVLPTVTMVERVGEKPLAFRSLEPLQDVGPGRRILSLEKWGFADDVSDQRLSILERTREELHEHGLKMVDELELKDLLIEVEEFTQRFTGRVWVKR